MLKRQITFEDFNGDKCTETHYFNLSKAELVEMEVIYKEGFEVHVQRIIESKDNAALIKEFKDIILMSYGEKSADGKKFVKNDELREAFSQTAAYQELFIELATKDGAADDFIIGVVPKELSQQMDQDKPNLAAKKSTAEIAAEQNIQTTGEIL